MADRKTVDIWCIETNYGYGWEVECEETGRWQAKNNKRAYQEAGVSVRVRKGRQPKAPLLERFGQQWFDSIPMDEAKAEIEFWKHTIKKNGLTPTRERKLRWAEAKLKRLKPKNVWVFTDEDGQELYEAPAADYPNADEAMMDYSKQAADPFEVYFRDSFGELQSTSSESKPSDF